MNLGQSLALGLRKLETRWDKKLIGKAAFWLSGVQGD